MLSEELAALAAARGASLPHRRGPPRAGPRQLAARPGAPPHDVQALREIVPDVADHDVSLCGSDGWMTAARTAAIEAGVPRDAVHLERFSY